jgi:polyphosphate glucokinase
LLALAVGARHLFSATPRYCHRVAVLAVGVDVGGTTVKCGLVDVATGQVTERIEQDTPSPSTPENVADLVARLVAAHPRELPVGVASPGVIRQGVVQRAVNLHAGWTRRDTSTLMESAVGRPVTVLNDADAAGLAEIRHGAGKDHGGQVLVLTFGTGIGSALFQNGELVHNTELGQMEVDGRPGEYRAAAAALTRFDQSPREWVQHVNHYVAAVEQVLYPDLLIIGGGITRSPDGWWEDMTSRTDRVLARFRDSAGIVGAALAANRTVLTPGRNGQASG